MTAGDLALVEVAERRGPEDRRRRRVEVRAELQRGWEGALPQAVADWPGQWRDAWVERVALMVVCGLLEEREAERQAERRVRREHAQVSGLQAERVDRGEPAAAWLSP